MATISAVKDSKLGRAKKEQALESLSALKREFVKKGGRAA
jgi:hypothetical protein